MKSVYLVTAVKAIALVHGSEYVPGASFNHVSDAVEIPVFNELWKQIYTLNLTMGTPPQAFSVLFDTGSSDLWLPDANSPGCAPDACPPGAYFPNASTTSVDIRLPFNASYGLTPDNIMLGEFYNDTMDIGGITITNQSFAYNEVVKLVLQSQQWGLIGFGTRYGSSTFLGQSSPIRGDISRVPVPVWEHLYDAGFLEKKLFSVWLNSQSARTGSVLLGSVDKARYRGQLESTSLILTGPEGWILNWGVNLISVAYLDRQAKRQLMNGTYHVVLDTGSPNMYLPRALWTAITAPLNAIWQSVPNDPPTTPYVPCSFRNSSASLMFGFPGVGTATGPHINVPIREIIYPFGLPSIIGPIRADDGEELCYLGAIPTDGEIYLLGATFIRSAYVVFDAENKELSMAQARWSDCD